jgi:WD40 repeat protein
MLEDVETISSSSTLSISLKWNKHLYEFEIPPQSTGRTLKERVCELTQVPIDRQKIMGKGYWKGMLKDDTDFCFPCRFRQPNADVVVLKLTMMGSAEVLQKPTTLTTFVEDMTPEQQQQIQQQTYQQSLQTVTGMIPAIQTLPQDRSKDNYKQADEMYPYNRLVHGLPQYQIENILQEQEQLLLPSNTEEVASPRLSGRVVMTLGLELQRAYINDLTTLADGALISGLEDGHIHGWKHGKRVFDLIHGPASSNNSNRGVESVMAITYNTTKTAPTLASFVTAGRGTIRVWTEQGEPIVSVSTPYPYATPTGLVQLLDFNDGDQVVLLCLAARFVVTPPPSNRPYLIPQDEMGRQRLAHIETQEALVEQTMSRLRRSIQLWYGQECADGQFALLSTMLEAASSVTALVSWNTPGGAFLAAGDEQGGIQIWKMTTTNRQPHFTKLQHYRIGSINSAHSAIVCMKYDNAFRRLFVSTRSIHQPIAPIVPSDVQLVPINTDVSQGVHVLDVDTVSSPVLIRTIQGHKDAASCIQPLPNGDLITAGGKFDATMKVWSGSQLALSLPCTVLTEPFSVNLCADVGYVFALTVLEDTKDLPNGAACGSESSRKRHFGIAAARYNVIKVIL